MAVESYDLLAADGTSVEARDESKPLPGYGSGNETTDTAAPDTDPPAEPDTNTPVGDTTETPDATEQTVVWRYSTRLKVMIVATGCVVGASLYAAIVVPYFVKKKRAGRYLRLLGKSKGG